MQRPTAPGDRIHRWRYLRLDRPHRLSEISLFLDLHRRRDSDDISLRFNPKRSVNASSSSEASSNEINKRRRRILQNRWPRCARSTASTTKRRPPILRSETASPNEPTGRFAKGYVQSALRPSSRRNSGPNSLVLLHISKPTARRGRSPKLSTAGGPTFLISSLLAEVHRPQPTSHLDPRHIRVSRAVRYVGESTTGMVYLNLDNRT
jgi:hypothetical protein